MTIDEAIKYCLDVVEKNDLAADMYDLLAQNNHNTYEKLTAETNYSHCIKSSSNHKQIAELLKELKELRIKSASMEKNDNEVKQLLEHFADANYINDKILGLYKTLSISAIKEPHEARRLLKLAVGCLNDGGCTKNCDECANYIGQTCGDYDNFKWKYTDEASKLIEGTNTQTSTPDNTRNLTSEETDIYNNAIEQESSYTGVNLECDDTPCGMEGKECAICGTTGFCVASSRDDYWIPATKEDVIYRLDNHKFPNYTQLMIDYLKTRFNYDYEVSKDV